MLKLLRFQRDATRRDAIRICQAAPPPTVVHPWSVTPTSAPGRTAALYPALSAVPYGAAQLVHFISVSRFSFFPFVSGLFLPCSMQVCVCV